MGPRSGLRNMSFKRANGNLKAQPVTEMYNHLPSRGSRFDAGIFLLVGTPSQMLGHEPSPNVDVRGPPDQSSYQYQRHGLL